MENALTHLNGYLTCIADVVMGIEQGMEYKEGILETFDYQEDLHEKIIQYIQQQHETLIEKSKTSETIRYYYAQKPKQWQEVLKAINLTELPDFKAVIDAITAFCLYGQFHLSTNAQNVSLWDFYKKQLVPEGWHQRANVFKMRFNLATNLIAYFQQEIKIDFWKEKENEWIAYELQHTPFPIANYQGLADMYREFLFVNHSEKKAYIFGFALND